MTKEEAIQHLENIIIFSYQDGYTNEAREALKMAIEAFKAEPCDNLKAVKSIINKEINLLEERMSSENSEGRWVEVEKCQCAIEYLEFIDEYVKALPSVTPEQKTGKIIIGGYDCDHYICSECGEDFGWYSKPNHKYCPNCGAKMEEENK